MDYPKHFVLNYHSAIFDETTQLIYVSEANHMFIIDLNSKSIRTLSLDADYDRFPLMFEKDDNIHIYARFNHDNYTIFNKRNCTFQQIKNNYNIFDVHITFDSFNMKTRDSVITSGIINNDNESIWKSVVVEYSHKNNKWICWDIDGIRPFVPETVATKNEHYLIFIGGVDECQMSVNDILVYDLINQKLLQSSIKVPCSGSIRAIIMRNDVSDNLLVFGYIHQSCHISEFPVDLIECIEKWVCFERIHVVGATRFDQPVREENHWSIDIDHIIQCAKQE